MKVKLVFAVLVSAAVLQGCSITDRGDNYQTMPTVGQELLDLDRAYNAGVLNDSEYDRQKNKILRK